MPSGAWRAATRVNDRDTLNTRAWSRDPQHRDPDPNPGVRHNSWDAAQGMSATPTGITTVQDSWSVDESRAVYLDQTPEDHQDGIGSGPGLTVQESMAVNAAARKVDRGGMIARLFAQPETDNGTYRADLETQPEFNAGNIETIRLKQRSDPENSPNARMGNRVVRVMDRIYKTMRWEPDFRPLYLTNAYSGSDQAATRDGAMAASPFSSLARVVRNTPARPQLRRTPPSWDDAQLEDAAATPVDHYGFQSWSL